LRAAGGTMRERERSMNVQRFDFLLLVTVAAAAAAPALGQAAAPAVGRSNSATQGDAAIPDFSGIWARVSFPGFGRPLAGAGPVINKKRTPNGVRRPTHRMATWMWCGP
jgi:hypothetical protein